MSDHNETAKRHPIRVAARRTGLNQDVLRAWEIRYGAVLPERSAGGQRLYSDADIERLRLIRLAQEGGRRVGQVAGLSLEELRTMVHEDELSAVSVLGEGDPVSVRTRPQSFLEQSLEAVRRLDATHLEAVLRRAAVNLEGTAFVDHVLAPLMIEIGDLWHSDALTPGHERLATTVVRRLLDEQRSSLANDNGPRIVVATPAGQHHEIGAMLAAASAAAEGWNVIYLGPNLPAASIAEAAVTTGARAVALSLIYPSDDPRLPDELKELRRSLPENVIIIVGGQAAGAYRPALEELGALWLPDAPALRSALDLAQTSRRNGNRSM